MSSSIKGGGEKSDVRFCVLETLRQDLSLGNGARQRIYNGRLIVQRSEDGGVHSITLS